MKSAVSEQDLTRAKQKYQELYSIYQQINDSQLEKIHKEVAYQQLVTSYHLIQDLKDSTTTPTNIIAIAVVIILVSVVVFINPRMVGLAVFQESISQPVNFEFSQSGSREITFKSLPSSLSVSGEFVGDGTAKLFAESEGRRMLVFDSTKSNIQATKFTGQCIDTCVLPKVGTTKMTLFAEVDKATLKLNSINYYTRLKNTAPVWNGEPKVITVQGKTTVDFSKYFTDSDGDELVYLVTTPEGINAEVSGSIVTFTADQTAKGEKFADLIVSDMKHSTRAKIKLEIE